MNISDLRKSEDDALLERAHAARQPLRFEGEKQMGKVEEQSKLALTFRRKLAKLSKDAPPDVREGIDAALERTDEIVTWCSSRNERLEAIAERVNDSAAEVSAARIRFQVVKEEKAKGTLDAAEAITLRDEVDIVGARLVFLERAHSALLREAEAGASQVVERFWRATNDAKQLTASIAKAYKAIFGASATTEPEKQGEAVKELATVGFFYAAEVDEIASTPDAAPGTQRSKAGLAALFDRRRAVALARLNQTTAA